MYHLEPVYGESPLRYFLGCGIAAKNSPAPQKAGETQLWAAKPGSETGT